ncbi:MAG: sulfurtransferase [Pseudolabrys sp.]|nr:sulfurtransferase [Pseudolabrys sp.]MDP2298360.1 sulfurtransferase [Pseudolabrys sp.]
MRIFASLFARRFFTRSVGAAALAALVTLGASFTASAAPGAEPLVTVEWLKNNLNDKDVVVLDIRSAIDGGGAKAFAEAHIPGSVHSDYDKAGWRVTRNNVPFMLPTVAELEKLIGDIGIDEDKHVVVVPAGVSYTDFGSAARTYWTLKVVGLKNVSILDGGVAAWRAAGLPVESGEKKPTATIFTATLDKSLIAQGPEVEAIESKGNAVLIDARPASFFFGKEKAPNASAYGHIPGSVNVDSAAYYDARTNKLKPKAELVALSSHIPAGPAVSYCNTGHWAATDWFVLHELLGRKDVRVYDGSMVEWTANASRPVESSRTKWDDLKKALGLGS